MRSQAEVRQMMDRVLSLVTTAEAVVEYTEEQSLATRFGDNAITQNKSGGSAGLSLTVASGARHGSSATNRLDEEGLAQLVRRAEAVASGSPEDPEYMPPVGPVEYPQIPCGFFDSTSRADPEQLAGAISACTESARNRNMEAAGTFEVGHGARAIADSRGLFGYDSASSAEFGITVRTASGSGKATACSEDIRRIDPAALAERAMETAENNRDQLALEPGEYVVVLSPHAVAGLLSFLFMNMEARQADEGVSPFSGQVGRKLFDERVKITSPIDDPDIPPPLYGASGLPVKESVWVEDGVLKRLMHSRFWANEKGADPDPHLAPLRMEGEDRSFEELVGMCERGLLVNRLWYIRYVDQKELLLTGMTRDGLFLVEGGKATRAVKNFRFNESPLQLLRSIVAMSRPERASAYARVPGILARDFTMSSTTDF